MPKGKIQWTEDKIEKRSNEGYGQGTLSKYKPWTNIQDKPSTGRVSRVQGYKTNRIHHFLSDLETRFFYLCEWSNNVIDIREKFPLNRVQTVEIAESKNIKHPIDIETKTTLVMTTDFLLTLKDSTNLAVSILPSSDLFKKRIIERLEIERCYWEKQNIRWKIVTEKELSKTVFKNIEWAHSSLFEHLNEDELLDLSSLILELNKSKTTIENTINFLEAQNNKESGYFLSLLKYAIAHKMIGIDLKKPFQINQLPSELKISKEEFIS